MKDKTGVAAPPRTVYVGTQVAAALKAEKQRQKTLKIVHGRHYEDYNKVIYSLDFDVHPHQLRHTYITNLISASVDPKTVQYLAGHKNSKITMDIYAKVKYNQPEQLRDVINTALRQ